MTNNKTQKKQHTKNNGTIWRRNADKNNDVFENVGKNAPNMNNRAIKSAICKKETKWGVLMQMIK